MATVTLKEGYSRSIPLGIPPDNRMYDFTAGVPVDVPDEEAPRFQADDQYTVVVAEGTPDKPAPTQKGTK